MKMMLAPFLFIAVIPFLSASALSIDKSSALYDDDQHTIIVRGAQATLNKMVDLALEAAKKKLDEINQGKWPVPDINEEFSTGKKWWKIKGEFNTREGDFEGLRSIGRNGDAILKKDGLIYTASCEFSIPKSYIKYNYYKLKYGPVKVDGKLSAKINNIRIFISYVIDYTQSECQTSLSEVRISDVNEVEIDATGLGSLNHLYSKLVTWVTKKWRGNVVGSLDRNLQEILAENVNNFNCEKYRPLE